jgi:hypothetical protein
VGCGMMLHVMLVVRVSVMVCGSATR